jgi:ATP-binding cassette, subfamily B, bacterial
MTGDLLVKRWIISLFGALKGRVRETLFARRVPVILQQSRTECGLACLAMILSYHCRKTRISEMRERLGIGRDGVTALAISQWAQAYGLKVKAYSLSPADFKSLALPAIVHWNFNHFVVVERWSSKHVWIVDPECGRSRLTTDEFDRGFTGVVLTFEPGADFARRQAVARRPVMRYLYDCGRHAPGWLFQIILASLLLQVLGLAGPIITKVLIDHVIRFQVSNVMTILGVGLSIVFLTQAIVTYLRSVLLLHLQYRLDSKMMLGFFEHLLMLPYRYFQQRTSGDLLMRLSSNTVIREILTSQTLSLALDGSLVVVYFTILWFQQSLLGLLALCLGALQITLLLATARRTRLLSERELATQAKSQSYLFEALSRIEVIKSSGKEDWALDHWSRLLVDHLNVSFKRSHFSAQIEAMVSALKTLSPLVFLWVGTHLVLAGQLSLGTMLALTALASAFLAPLSSLVANGQRLQIVGSHLERLADVIEAAPEQSSRSNAIAPRLSGQIELRRVSFRYNAMATPVLTDISFTIQAGQKIALVGRTGAGKSSLAKLLIGLYAPTEGEIFYDGIPLSSLNYRSLRRQFGVLCQDAPLFSGSIRQNIAFGDMQMPMEQVVAAARQAAIHDEILRMPMKYETLIGESDGGLSGGQRQRIALARALVTRPSVLLLDEATSHLDVETERMVEERLSELSCTRIIIAHRLSTILSADVIYVMDQGRLVGQGAHHELLESCAAYTSLIHNRIPEVELNTEFC